MLTNFKCMGVSGISEEQEFYEFIESSDLAQKNK